MNKVILNQKIKSCVLTDKFEFESNLCKNLKVNILNVLKDYFDIDENKTKLSIQLMKNGEIRFNFCCVLNDLSICNFK